MINEPALQPRGASGSEYPGVFSWAFPGSPVRINLRLDVILKLQAATSQDHGLTRSSEVGGVLIGHSHPPGTLEINDCIFLPGVSDGSQRYVLNLEDLGRLRRERSSPRDERRSVVGYFRTQRDQGLSLRETEVAMMEQHFRDPMNVGLLIQDSGEQSTAGFVFWDGGSLVPFSLLDFPLDVAALQLDASAFPEEPTESWTPGVKDTAELARLETPREVVARQAPAREVATREAPARAATPMLPPPAPAARTPQRAPVPYGLMVGIVGVLLAGAAAFVLWQRSLSLARPLASTQFPASSLQLQVEALGNGLNLRWNPSAAAISHATAARLVVLESDREPKAVELDVEQLLSGHVFFLSSAEQVRFRLEVLKDAAILDKESVLVLNSAAAGVALSTSGKPEAAAPRPVRSIPIVEAPPTGKGVFDTPHPSIPPAANSLPSAPQEDIGDARRDRSVPAKLFQPPRGAEIAQTAPVLLPGPAPLAQDRIEAALDSSPASLPSFTAPPAPAPQGPQAPPPSNQAPVEPKASAFAYTPPSPIQQVGARMTNDVRSALAAGDGNFVISVRVAIDAAGKVTRAEVSPGSVPVAGQKADYLRAAALGAARSWLFRPATLNGKSIPSEFIIDFKFR
jgi:hypothetical protein